jgi:hypothetical protein
MLDNIILLLDTGITNVKGEFVLSGEPISIERSQAFMFVLAGVHVRPDGVERLPHVQDCRVRAPALASLLAVITQSDPVRVPCRVCL